jgi:predicted  nucleic acid-binding Zn-ribbon protein
MLKQLYELARRILFLSRELDECKEQIRGLQKQMEELTATVHRLAYEVRRVNENDAHEREKMALRLENALLRFERRLPPARQSPDIDGD